MSILVSILLFYTVIEHSVMVSARGCPGSTCISPVWLERCKQYLSLSLSVLLTQAIQEPGVQRQHWAATTDPCHVLGSQQAALGKVFGAYTSSTLVEAIVWRWLVLARSGSFQAWASQEPCLSPRGSSAFDLSTILACKCSLFWQRVRF